MSSNTTTVITDKSDTDSNAIEKLLTTRTVLIASAIFIVVLLAIIVCLIWKFIKMGRQHSNDKKSNATTVEIDIKYSKEISSKSAKYNRVSLTDKASNSDISTYSPKTVNIVITPKQALQIKVDPVLDEFVLMGNNVENNKDNNENKNTISTTIDPNTIKDRKVSAATNVLSEGHQNNIQSLPDIDSILLEIDPINENEEQYSTMCNLTIDSNTTRSTIKYKLPQNNITKIGWM